jgi:undecaprenyl pyrophosphate phosphatase UppP
MALACFKRVFIVSMLFVYCATFLQLVAESFPVSSSGHLALLNQVWSKFLANTSEYQLSFPWSDPVFWERYVDLLHVVPLIVIAVYFYPRWRIFLVHPLRTWRSALKLIGYVVLADGVTAILYFTRAQFSFSAIPLWVGFSATALLLFGLLFVPTRKASSCNASSGGASLGKSCLDKDCLGKVYACDTCSGSACSGDACSGDARLSVTRAVLLGLFQGLALLPGLSRFAATFCGGRYLGFSSRSAFEISFMLQWPLLLAAVARSILFFIQHAAEVVVTPVLLAVLFVSAAFGIMGFYLAARLAHSERLWYCAFYVVAVAFVAGMVA